MRSIRRFSLVSIVLLAIAGCGDDGSPPPPPDEDGGAGTDAGPRDAGDADGGPGDAGPMDASVVECTDPDGPEVQIVEPTPATDPNEDEVLIANERVEVRCTATKPGTPGSRPVNPESVGIVRLNEDGSVADSPAVTIEDDEFVASFNVSDVDNGPIRFRCTAQDTAEEPRCGLAELETLLDRGPTIEVLQPAPGSIHADAMTLRYEVAPAPLTDGDMEAGVASQELVVAGVAIEDVTESSDGTFEAAIDFTDTTVFDETLVGDFDLMIRATNMRTPEAATRQHMQPFTVDSTGPDIVFEEPDEGELVGGRVRVAATITDPAGVDDSTVILRIGTDEYSMRRVEPDGDIFEVFFDASTYGSSIRELTLNITAADNVANDATRSRVVKLDSTPPIADLTPPDVREGKYTSGGSTLECSTLFDPVGSDSLEDGEIAGTAAEFRARVQELGNQHFAGSGTVTFLAGMNNAKLYLLDDTSTPLLVDGDGDGVCDSINSAVEPDPGDPDTAVVVDLEAISPSGTPYYQDGIDATVEGSPASAYDGVFGSCEAGSRTSPPSLECEDSSPLTRIIAASLEGNPPAIWAKPPVTATTCVGDAFDFQGVLDEGWACVAVRAEDNLGNVGVSPPMRTCFVDGMGSDPCPGSVGSIAAESERPSCTDGCTLPPDFADYPELQLVIPD